MVATLIAAMLGVTAPATPATIALEAGVFPGLAYGVSINAYSDVGCLLLNGMTGPEAEGWSALVGWAVLRTPGLTVAPMIGAVQPFSPTACPADVGGPCPQMLVSVPTTIAVGVAARWNAPRWWFAVTPTLTPYLDRGLIATFETGPPFVELGWKPVSHLGIALRASAVPVVVTYTFGGNSPQ